MFELSTQSVCAQSENRGRSRTQRIKPHRLVPLLPHFINFSYWLRSKFWSKLVFEISESLVLNKKGKCPLGKIGHMRNVNTAFDAA